MTTPYDNLQAVQSWFQQAVMAPQPPADSSEQRREVDERIGPSLRMTSAERLAIYQGSYWARLLECLRATFPTVAKLLGDDALDALTFGYLQSFPSQSYSLNDLGRQFPAYLQATRPAGDEAAGGWFDFVIELAQLDALIDEVFDGPGTELEPAVDWGALRSLSRDAWANLRFIPNPSLRICQFHFPVNDVFSAIRDGELPLPPERETTWLALCRESWIVRRYSLSGAEFQLLAALLEGHPLGAATATSDLTPEALSATFSRWTTACFFRGYKT